MKILSQFYPFDNYYDAITLTELPEKFEYVVGQALAIDLLQKAVYFDQIAPAYLFTGIEGIGKRLTANCLAKSILDTDNLTNHPDILIVEPTYQSQDELIPISVAKREKLELKSNPQIRIEQVREISQFVSRKPLLGQQLIVIIEGVETLKSTVANAFLKTLEEPGNATLILLTNQKEIVLPTIISRCQIIPFHPLSSEQLKMLLEEKGYQNLDNYPEIIELAQGSIGKALTLIQQFKTIPSHLLTGWQKINNSLALAKEISAHLDYSQQLWLLDYWQYQFWKFYHASPFLNCLEQAKKALVKHCNPHLVWDVCLIQLQKLEHGIN